MYYENFIDLCKAHGVAPNAVGKAVGVSSTTIAHWKKGLYTPKNDKLERLAGYFGVSVEYLRGETERNIDLDKEKILQHAFDDRPEMRTLFMVAQNAPKEDIEWVIAKLRSMSEK